MNQDPPLGPAAAAPTYRADWYPDPTRRFQLRYHNGRSWTGDVSNDGGRFLDPLTPAPFLVGTPPVRGFTNFSPQQESIAGALAAFVLGICSIFVGWVPFLCVFSGIGALVGLVLGIIALRRDSRRRREGGENSRGHGYAIAGVVLAPFGLAVTGIGIWLSVVALRAVDDFTDVGAHRTEVVSCQVGDGRATAKGTITNETSTTRSYHVNVEFDRAGTSVRLNSGSTSVDDVGPGDTETWTVTESVTSPNGAAVTDVDCAVSNVTGPVPFGES